MTPYQQEKEDALNLKVIDELLNKMKAMRKTFRTVDFTEDTDIPFDREMRAIARLQAMRFEEFISLWREGC